MDRRTRYSPEIRERAVWFTDCDDFRTVLTFAGEGARRNRRMRIADRSRQQLAVVGIARARGTQVAGPHRALRSLSASGT